MQDMTSSSSSAAYYQSMMMMAAATAKQQQQQPELHEQEKLKCPRCDSLNTKFCYYNNYNLSQPRHFCKNCRRYWTKGGSLRNIPVGGGSRKNTKRPGPGSEPGTGSSNKTLSVSDHRSSESDPRDFGSGSGSKQAVTVNSGQDSDPNRMLYGLPVRDPVNGSFGSMLASNMYGTGSGLGLDPVYRRSDDAWTDLAMNRVEKE
ncbi:unnamed protein product [Cochlearia groenlandica]